MLTGRLLLALAPLAVVPLVSAAPASAASCRVMTVRFDLSGNQFVVLDPSHYDIAFGGCVQFVNQTASTVTITVGSTYSEQIGPNENTTAATNYSGTSAGRQSVTATTSTGNAAHGSITVGASPSQAPSSAPPSSSSGASSPRPTTPPPAASPSASGTGPRVAPTPTRARSHAHSPGNRRSGLQPPVSPPGPIQVPSATPVPFPRLTPTAVVAGPVEPASDRNAGLPAALAALAVVGAGGALLRVLAAEPVDDGESVGDPS